MKNNTSEKDVPSLKRMPTPEEIRMLAQNIELLISFAAQLIPDLDVLEDVVSDLDEKHSTNDASSVIQMALGMDYEKNRMNVNLRLERSKALFEFVKVLKQTETDRV